MKIITLKELNELIAIVQGKLLTSHNITDRAKCPSYIGPKVPQALSAFKERLIAYREVSSNALAKEPELDLPRALRDLKNFSKGTLAHEFTGSLAIAKFGFGECGECTYSLVLELITRGYGHVGFVAIQFPNAKSGMETTHQFLVLNLAHSPAPPGAQMPLIDFIRLLPKNAYIADPFLEIAYAPDSAPPIVNDYMNAYGGQAKVIRFMHLTNFKLSHIQPYLRLANELEKEIQQLPRFSSDQTYDLSKKKEIDQTEIVRQLKENKELDFVAFRDDEYQIDAVLYVDDAKTKESAVQLRSSLKGHGQFFRTPEKKELFVLEGVNLSDCEPSLGGRIQSLFK